MITVQELKRYADKTIITNDFLIKHYDISLTKTDKQFITGILQSKGAVSFKIWANNSAFNKFVDNNYQDKIINAKVKVSHYGGELSLEIIEVYKVYENNDLPKEDFYDSVYDKDDLEKKMIDLMTRNLSPIYLNLFSAIYNKYREEFTKEFAAIYNHDNTLSGLMAHTYKMLRFAELMIDMGYYEDLIDTIDPDILLVSIFLHDLGKIKEYNIGGKTDYGFVSHRYFGLELITPFKQSIITHLGEDVWYTFIAVIMQHHGEYEEKPKIVISYVVHLIDNLEAQLTSLNEKVKLADNINMFGMNLNSKKNLTK